MRLLLGVTGGIAAYKAVETARLAIKAGHSVRVIQTPASQRFVGAATFEGITGAPVLCSEFEPDPARGGYPDEPPPEHAPISHLALVENADAYLIAPASANTIAKLAVGIADNLVTTAALAARCPVLVAPAMNNHMYLNPATQTNIGLLTERGVVCLEPAAGQLASHGEEGVGRLPEPAGLLAAVEERVARQPDVEGSWHGLRILISAGGTREPIDSVRYIGNRSSGRMGYALARAALARGAEVTVLSANVALPLPQGVEVIAVQTAAQLQAAAEREFAGADVLIMAAAVADFRPANPAAHKLKKTGPEALERIELEPTPDIISALAEVRRPGQIVVGFAAEHGSEALAYAREKRERKSLDAVVVNDISRPEIGFDTTENEVVIVTAEGETPVPRDAKDQVADMILDAIDALRS